MLDNINETIIAQVEKVKAAVGSVADKIAELKDNGAEKIMEYFNEMTASFPLIEESGFQVDSINVDIALPPDISIALHKKKEVPRETIEKLIEENEDKKMLVIILRALLTADSMQQKITLNKFAFTCVSVKLGIPPAVSLKYS